MNMIKLPITQKGKVAYFSEMLAGLMISVMEQSSDKELSFDIKPWFCTVNFWKGKREKQSIEASFYFCFEIHGQCEEKLEELYYFLLANYSIDGTMENLLNIQN